ncbi:MCE family protein [Coxiella endosymbiont of Ornithodoros amblus]|uniref:MlaD family protein n=1 Tax=Coxiella endosymbiont of Ornithodoros amblus TaxID=1656166 RepID=UPI00244DABEC|nr:MlaD family protein [Coxiella endosymbiont of Ornithodoros amblus]MBW5803023.1 MCE family protein [Coxiella endosymbiont of Ornithodoros amblus]
MDTKVNYTLVGFFIILLGAASIVILLWFSTFRHRQTFDTYLTYMHEEVSGISAQTPVRFNGVKVGYVQKIEINPADPQQVVLTLKIQHETPITTSTIATLRSEGIMGTDYVALKALTATAPPLIAKLGEKYPVIPSEPSLLMKLSTALQEVTKTIKELSDNVGRVFDEENRRAISASLVNIQKVTKTLLDNSENIDATLYSMKRLMKNTAKASEQLPTIMHQLQDALVNIKITARQFDRAGHGIELTVGDAHTAIQNMSTQILPTVLPLLTKLNATAAYLQELSIELQHNPSMLVRGKHPPLPGPGER